MNYVMSTQANNTIINLNLRNSTEKTGSALSAMFKSKPSDEATSQIQ